MDLNTVTDVKRLAKARLCVRLPNGRTVKVTVAEYLTARGSERLRNPAFFARATVAEWVHGVRWPWGIGIPFEALNRLANEQPRLARSTQRLNAWMKRHGLSTIQAAKALRLSGRTILYYRTGAKSIPI